MDYFKGVCGPKKLSSIIKKIVSLGKVPKERLVKLRWVLDEGTVKRLFKTSRKHLAEQPSLLRVPTPIVCVGDIHGDLLTLLDILQQNGMPPQTSYLFLGDYVDRGRNGMEVLMLVLAMACKWPDKVFVLRGNHESALMTKTYGFLEECRTRYSTYMYVAAVRIFDLLPLAAVVGKHAFAVHGGLSPRLKSTADIEAIQRPCVIAPDTLIADLTWGDPRIKCDAEYIDSDRGVGYYFSRSACEKFLKDNAFEVLIRAHETCRRGVRKAFGGQCITVFSHPRYLNLDNAAGALVVSENGRKLESQIYTRGVLDTTTVEEWPENAEDEVVVDAADDESVIDLEEFRKERLQEAIVNEHVPTKVPELAAEL